MCFFTPFRAFYKSDFRLSYIRFDKMRMNIQRQTEFANVNRQCLFYHAMRLAIAPYWYNCSYIFCVQSTVTFGDCHLIWMHNNYIYICLSFKPNALTFRVGLNVDSIKICNRLIFEISQKSAQSKSKFKQEFDPNTIRHWWCYLFTTFSPIIFFKACACFVLIVFYLFVWCLMCAV